MPEQVTQNYTLSGWQTVTLYTEQEMADALEITRAALREHLTAGRIGLAYHGNPLNTHNREYTFLPSTYLHNQARWKCVTEAGGHYFEFVNFLDSARTRAKYQCHLCGVEAYR